MTALALQLRALRYEAVRLSGLRESRAVLLISLLAAAAFTLPAAREVAERAPGPGSVAWVVSAGTLGRILPAPAAAVGAAWFGAMAVVGEYRHRGALITFIVLPRRGMVLAARLIVVALVGAVLCAAVQGVAYGMARLGFALAARGGTTPGLLAAPRPAQLATAVGCGVLGILAAWVVRMRLFAIPVALILGAAAVAAAPRSSSPALKLLAKVLDRLPQVVRLAHQGELAIAVGLATVAIIVLAALSLGRRRIG
jgi:ABC-2 type transport system permease protein